MLAAIRAGLELNWNLLVEERWNPLRIFWKNALRSWSPDWRSGSSDLLATSRSARLRTTNRRIGALEIERQLSLALRSLAAEYGREQRNANGLIAGLSAHVATMREQVEQMQGHAHDSAADYGKLARDYRQMANTLDRLSKR